MAHRIVGLDIGTSALRAVELLVDDGDRPVLEAYGQVGLPPGTIVDGEVRDRSQVTASLRRLWHEGGFRTIQVQLGVAGLRAITREMELPPVPPDELDAAVNLQAEDIVPFPMEETTLDSTVVSRTADAEGNPLIRVLVAAAHRDLVNGVVAAVEDAGLEPFGIDLDTAALSRAFSPPGSAGGEEGEAEVVVSVGAGLTMVVVHRGGSLQFVRTVDLGGDAVTRALASALDLPFVDAEALKRRLGEPGHHEARALAVVAGVVDELVAEIHRSIRYYAALPGRTPPARVLVTGGAARTAGLFDKLQQGVEVPVLEASPLSFVDVSRLRISREEIAAINPTVAVPLGLALNGPARTKFDLMPREVAVRRAERRVRRLLVIAAIGVVVLLAAASAWRVLGVRSAERQVGSLDSLVHTLNTVDVPKYDKAVKLTDEVTGLQAKLRPLVAHEVDWLVVLDQLGQYLPPTAALQGVDLTAATQVGGAPLPPTGAGKGVIGTGTSTVSTGNLTEVKQFGLAMAGAPALGDVSLSGSVSASTSAVTFPVGFDITTAARGQRTDLFDGKVP